MIDLPSMRLSSFTLRAEGSPLTLDEVLFELKGPISETYRDLSPPFRIFEEKGKFFTGKSPQPGQYKLILTATRNGVVGSPQLITFRMVSSLIESFTLVRTDTDQNLMPLVDGAVIDPSIFGGAGFNVRANVEANVVRVVFEHSGPHSGTQDEGNAPFTLFGDVSGDYYGEDPLLGDYTVTATPYTEDDDSTFVASSPTTIHFTIAEPTARTLQVYPNSFNNEIFLDTPRKERPVQIQFQSVQGHDLHIVLGQQVIQEKKRIRVSTQHLPSGQYIMRVIGRDWTETRHVIKQ